MPDCCNKCCNSIHAQGFNALQRSTSAKSATIMVTFPVYATKRRLRHITRTVTETPMCTNFMQVQCMHRTVPITVIPRSPDLMNPFAYSCKSKSNHAEGKPVHLITNLALLLETASYQKYVPKSTPGHMCRCTYNAS